jgi:NAD(P)-dependent dehydrogenase (short-subunit alcohol dehydrogenase family)
MAIDGPQIITNTFADPNCNPVTSTTPCAVASKFVECIYGVTVDYGTSQLQVITGPPGTVTAPINVSDAPHRCWIFGINDVDGAKDVVYKRGEFEQAGWDKVMAVNLDSLMNCARRFKAQLAATKGSLITVSSVAGFGANVGNPAYAASKAGAVSLTRTLGNAWAGEGIRVNGIAPGLVDTKLTKVTTENPQRLAGSIARIPQGRLGTPEDMAGAVLFLASPLAAYVTGQTLIVDGGLTL